MRKGLQPYIVIAGAFVVLAAGIFFTLYQPEPAQAPTNSQAQEASVVSIILTAGGDEWRYSSTITEPRSLADVLLELDATNDDFTLTYTDYGGDLGIFIQSINGVGGEGAKWWQYWVNGQYAMVGVSQHMVAPGDSVEFLFTDEQYEE